MGRPPGTGAITVFPTIEDLPNKPHPDPDTPMKLRPVTCSTILPTAFAALFATVFAPPAKADKFHFGPQDETAKTEGNAVGRVVQGVLIKQDKDTYTIRIVGGEITVAKSMVTKIEKDGLTAKMIETMENNQKDQLTQQNTNRRQVQAAEASARKAAAKPAAQPAEKSLIIEVDFQNLLPGYTFRTFDPVLHRANLSGLRQVIEDFLRREVRSAAHRK